MSMEYTILNQVKELEDGTVTVPLFREHTVKTIFSGESNTNEDGIGYNVSYRMEMAKGSKLKYSITVYISDRRIETTNPNDVIFATWYPRGPKGWTEPMNGVENNRDAFVLKVLGSPDYLQAVPEGSAAFRELMKGYKQDSPSAYPEGPM